MSALLWIAFVFSGAGALGLELLWLRSAGLVLGATAATTATVLAGYFAGLAIGSVLARHPTARPIRRYAVLELAEQEGVSGVAAKRDELFGDYSAAPPEEQPDPNNVIEP